DDRAVRQLVAGPVMVCDDDVEAELTSAPDLFDGGDAAVDGQDEPAALLCEPLERLAADAVALVEAARDVPLDLCPELAQPEHACRDLAEAELLREAARLPVRARTDRPDALRHARLPYERCRTAHACGRSSSSIQV